MTHLRICSNDSWAVKRRKRTALSARGALFVLILILLSTVALAQESPPSELQARMSAAAEAQQTGNPVVVSQANRRLIAFTLAQVAELREMQGQTERSAELYLRSLDFEDNPNYRYRYAIALMTIGKLDEALKQTSKLLEQDPQNAAAWHLRGKLQMSSKQYDDAVVSLAKAQALEPQPEAAFAMASALIKLRQTAKAQDVFKGLEDSGMNSARVHIMAGRAYEDPGLADDAEREYKTAIALDPKSRGHYFLGLFYLSHNGWEPTPRARQEFVSEVQENPTDFFGNYFLGYLAANDKDYDNSDRYLKIAAAAMPDWPEPYLYMGLNAYGRGNNKDAEDFLRKAIELTGADESRNNYQIRRAYFTLGRILIQAGRKEEGTGLVERSKAIETKLVVDSRPQALDQAKAAAGSDSSAGKSLSPSTTNLTPEQKSQIAAAEKTLSAILGDAYNDLGTSEARRDDYATALLHFRDAQQWNAAIPGLTRNIALAAFLSGDYQQSEQALRTLVRQDASDRRSQSMLALSLYMLKQYSDAAKAFDQVREDALADPRMSFAWADTLVQIKDPQRAGEILGQLTSQALPATMWIRAGQLYAAIGDSSNAQRCYEKAKQEDATVRAPQ